MVDDDYYNTNEEEGIELASSQGQARHQQAIILAFFRLHRGQAFAPHEVPMPPGTPLTSVRRAMTNLTAAGDLEKTSTMRAGTFGKKVHTWRLYEEPEPAAFGQGELF